jgi:hypothetical protein
MAITSPTTPPREASPLLAAARTKSRSANRPTSLPSWITKSEPTLLSIILLSASCTGSARSAERVTLPFVRKMFFTVVMTRFPSVKGLELRFFGFVIALNQSTRAHGRRALDGRGFALFRPSASHPSRPYRETRLWARPQPTPRWSRQGERYSGEMHPGPPACRRVRVLPERIWAVSAPTVGRRAPPGISTSAHGGRGFTEKLLGGPTWATNWATPRVETHANDHVSDDRWDPSHQAGNRGTERKGEKPLRELLIPRSWVRVPDGPCVLSLQSGLLPSRGESEFDRLGNKVGNTPHHFLFVVPDLGHPDPCSRPRERRRCGRERFLPRVQSLIIRELAEADPGKPRSLDPGRCDRSTGHSGLFPGIDRVHLVWNVDFELATGSARTLDVRCRWSDPEQRSIVVSVLIRFAPPSLTAKQYDDAVRRLTEDGVFPADGLDYEICFGSGDNLKVSQVWDSQQQLDAFGKRLMPILAELGINPGEPEVLEVHNIMRR